MWLLQVDSRLPSTVDVDATFADQNEVCRLSICCYNVT